MQQIIMLCVLLCAMNLTACSQTFNEWWHQTKTRLKYLHQQAAALLVLEKEAKEGDQIAENGTGAIGYINNAEYLQHLRYFRSLREVPLMYKQDTLYLEGVVEVSIQISRLRGKLPGYAASPWLNLTEQAVVLQEFEVMTLSAAKDIGEVRTLNSGSELMMNDGQRMEALFSVCVHMKSWCDSVRKKTDAIDLLIESRKQQAANDAFLKNILR